MNDLPRELRLLFTKGNDALAREIYDYAIDLFTQVLNKEPAVFDCRKALREAQFRKAGKGSGLFKKMLSTAASQPMVGKGQIALHKKSFAEALQIAEQILNGDPTNSGAHKLVIEAATAMEMPRTAVLSLEVLMRNSPKDRDVAIKFANALADSGEVVRAEKILADLYREFPTDGDLGQALKNISARRTMDKGGYEALADGKGSYRDILKNEAEAKALEQENRQVKTEDTVQRLIDEKEVRLKTDPKNVKILRDLAELYTQKQQFDRAMGYYERLKQTDAAADSSLDRGMAEMMSRKFDFEISKLDPAAPEYAEKMAKLQADKAAYQLEECRKRVERFPTDLQIRFELGKLYFQNGKINEAIQEFQKSQANPNRKIQSLNYLGQCFASRNMNELAIRTFENAIKEKPVLDDEKKELIYNLACVLEKTGKREDAIKQLEQIFAVDIGYKDVAAKVDAFYANQS